jgi:flagellar M-ring protein FliF
MLPAPVAAALENVKSRFSALSRPLKILIATTAALAGIFGSFILYREAHEPYAVLFTQLEQDDAAGIVAKLKELKSPFRLDAGGTTIEVPESKVAELRMDLVSAGLPRGGGVGFESFDKMRLGTTEFEQRVLYRRSLEGELARTIGSVAAVQTVRVHLVLPEKSVFVTRSEPASASIMLHLRAGRALGGGEVQGIVNLTASAVPGLTADHVAVVTTDGHMLKKPRGAGANAEGGDDEVAGEQRALESQLEDRARSMLEKVVGPGHVDVRVTAEVDAARVEHTEDHYDPARTALRSEELTRERSGTILDDSVAGVPGAESNLPSGVAAAVAAVLPRPASSTSPASSASSAPVGPASAAPPLALKQPSPQRADQPFRESHTRNFEVDHVSDKRVVGAGALKRVGVAVILDGVTHVEGGKKTVVPRERADLDRFAALVRSAVGANDARGDSVTVESVPFEETTAAAIASADDVAAATPVASPLTKLARRYGAAAGAGILLLAVASALAVARRRARKGNPVPMLAPVVEPLKLDAEVVPVDFKSLAFERAARDPATAALVLQFWLGTSESELKA